LVFLPGKIEDLGFLRFLKPEVAFGMKIDFLGRTPAVIPLVRGVNTSGLATNIYYLEPGLIF